MGYDKSPLSCPGYADRQEMRGLSEGGGLDMNTNIKKTVKKILCFFGFHNHEYRIVDFGRESPTVHARRCLNCAYFKFVSRSEYEKGNRRVVNINPVISEEESTDAE